MRRCVYGHRLGLGATSSSVYDRFRWWFTTYRYCSRECKEKHAIELAQMKDDKEAINRLFRPPSNK